MCKRGLLFGGNANNRSNAGLRYSNSNNSPTNANANISVHLNYNKLTNKNNTHRPCLLAKNKLIRNSFGSIERRRYFVIAQKAMKRVGNLYNKIIDIDNLRLADEKARKGKVKSYGVILHDKNKDNNILLLHKKLKNKEYKTSKYNVFKIYKPKERDIYQLPYYPDRIVHHAVMNILEPIWVSMFTADTFSCIKGRGIHGCWKKVKKALKDEENTKYCLKVDIKKYYPTINHEILKSLIRKKIKCNDTLELLDEIIDSAQGIPIGNYLSQYFANIYLTYFDHYVKEKMKVKYYFRYADDMVFLHQDKKELRKIYKEINTYLKDELKLEIKHNYQIFPTQIRGIDFVGYVFRNSHILIRKSIKQNFCRKIAKLKKRKLNNKEFKQGIAAWLGWCKYSNSINLLNKIAYERGIL